MKNSRFLISGVALATALAAGIAVASGGHMFKRLDRDDNGVISPAESQTAAAERFQRKDANGDGYIDINEMMSRWSDIPVDTDGDGKISAAEHQAMADRMFSRVDSDGDGQISENEAEELRESMRDRWRERHGHN